MTDIHETFDYGYDPTVQEDVPPTAPPRPVTLQPQATVNATWLPPVGKQTTPSCFVWASTYGLATFAAAKAANRSPSSPDDQASPTYTYIKVLQNQGVISDTCVGGKMVWPLDFLKTNGGTPSMSAAKNQTNCDTTWSAFGNRTVTPDAAFKVNGWKSIDVTGTDGLDAVRTMISQGTPLAYGTFLYTDFPTYDGAPTPYFGNKDPLYNKNTGKPAGHCMMIIGYDDTLGPVGAQGAVLIQNSFGPTWGTQWNGNGGYIWMAYTTFQTLAQGTAFYLTT